MSVKGDWPRPTAKPNEWLEAVEVVEMPVACTAYVHAEFVQGRAIPRRCHGELRLLARRFPTPGTVARQCAKCGQKYEARE